MDKQKLYAITLILGVAILAAMMIIFPGTLSVLGMTQYQENDEVTSEDANSPETTAEAFYAWYLDQFGDPAAGAFNRPDYHESQHLTDSFSEHIDELLADTEGKSGYDPFLCAQGLPEQVLADDAFLHGERASVVMRTNFSNHFFTVDLDKDGDGWKIGNVTCGSSPNGVAKAFYTWYLSYIGDRASDNFRNPMVDKAYQECGFLTEAYIAELDGLTSGELSFDPILMAQDIPHDFSVDPGYQSDNTAFVHLQFGTETVTHLKLSMLEEQGQWKIDAIELME